MEPINLFVDLFGVPIDTLIMLSAFVYFVVEAVKGRMSDVFTGGWKTRLLALALAFGLSVKSFYPNWETVIASTVLVWILPEGFHLKAKSNGGTK